MASEKADTLPALDVSEVGAVAGMGVWMIGVDRIGSKEFDELRARLHAERCQGGPGPREGWLATIDGTSYAIRGEKDASDRFTLIYQESALAEAPRMSVLHHQFEVTHAGRTYEWIQRTWWRKAFGFRRNNQVVGDLGAHHFFTHRSTIVDPDEVLLPFVVFLATLAVLLWNRGVGDS